MKGPKCQEEAPGFGPQETELSKSFEQAGIFWRFGMVVMSIVGRKRGAWGAQWAERPTSAPVTISQFVGSSPASGSVLTAQNLELLWILCLPLSRPLPCSRSLCLYVKYINILKKIVGRKGCSQEAWNRGPEEAASYPHDDPGPPGCHRAGERSPWGTEAEGTCRRRGLGLTHPVSLN